MQIEISSSHPAFYRGGEHIFLQPQLHSTGPKCGLFHYSLLVPLINNPKSSKSWPTHRSPQPILLSNMEKIKSLPTTPFSDPHNSMAQVPTVDFSLLTVGTPNQRSKVIQLLGHACREWGFFVVTNHNMPRTLMDEMLKVGKRFFDLTDEEKREYAGKQVLDSIICGKHLQREFLKM
ncbi:unnamed protein product, partial [Vitis vinifera]